MNTIRRRRKPWPQSLAQVLAALGALAVLTAATAAWGTPPGKNGQIAFRRYLDLGRTTGALFTIKPDGSGLQRVTHPPSRTVDQENDWSPDGRRIAFERKAPCPAGGPRNGLDNTCDLVYTVRSDGKALKRLVPCGFKATCHGVHTPAWSPDGTKLAFRYSLSDSRYTDSLNLSAGIWIVNADGAGLRQVTQKTPGSSWDFGPQWSPDGTRLVFVRVDLEREADALFTVRLDGTELFQVTPWELNGGDSPDWSPDGDWLLFRGEPADGSSNVYKAHPDGTELTNLTKQGPGGYHYLSSSFSPGGDRIVTARTPGTGTERHADLITMNADGSDVRPLTRTRFWESSADWGPRG